MNQKAIKIAGDTGELRRCHYSGSEDIIGHGVQHNGSHPKRKSIRNLLKAAIARFKKYAALIMALSDYIPKIIEIDEIYIKIQGNREFY